MDGAWSCFNPAIVNLPFLKSLNLGWVSLKDEFIQRLIAGCPFLQELTFENCSLGVTEKITCLSLKKLTIRNTVFVPDTLLRVFMPNLEYLSCQVHWGKVDFVNLSNLQHAIINLYGFKPGYDDSDDLEKFKLLKGLSNAKTLQLSGSLVNRMLKKEARNLPIFENLESLDLISFTINDDLDPIDLFLNRTPNLKKLILQNISMEKHEVFLMGFPFIKCGNLKTVEIVGLKSDTKLHELVNNLVLFFMGVENFSIIRTDAIDDSYAPKFIKYDSFADFADAHE